MTTDPEKYPLDLVLKLVLENRSLDATTKAGKRAALESIKGALWLIDACRAEIAAKQEDK
jgi:hypothetical protein